MRESKKYSQRELTGSLAAFLTRRTCYHFVVIRRVGRLVRATDSSLNRKIFFFIMVLFLVLGSGFLLFSMFPSFLILLFGN